MRTPIRRALRRGSVVPLVALSLVVLLLFAGLAVDWTYVRTTEFELRNASDAAAHAALLELRRSGDQTRAQKLAIDVAAMNYAAGSPVSLQPAQIQFGSWKYAQGTFTAGGTVNAVQVTARRDDTSIDGPVRLFFGPIFGHDASAQAEVAVGAYRSRDIELSLDISTSMIEEMNDAVAAITGFAAKMETRALPNDRVGLNVFKSSASEITTLQDVKTNISAIKTAWRGDGKQNTDKTKKSGVTNCSITYCYPGLGMCPATTKPAIPGTWMPQCVTWGPDGVYGGSNQGAGLLTAHNTLNAAPDLGNTKVIIFISDGYPTCIGGASACILARRAYATQQADLAWADGINIFTISLNSTASTVQTKFMASLVRGYGKAFETPKSSDLDAILTEIEKSIPIALVE